MTKQSDLTESEIDDLIIRQADDDASWDEPIDVEPAAALTLTLSPPLAARAAFFARLHQLPDAAAWLQAIIEERIAFEEAAFANLKRVMERPSRYDT